MDNYDYLTEEAIQLRDIGMTDEEIERNLVRRRKISFAEAEEITNNINNERG